MKPVVLGNLASIHDWQCAFDAVKHADPDQKITLEYGVTDEPDIQLTVTETDDFVAIYKEH